MAFAIVAGVTVPVDLEPQGASKQPVRIGAQKRAYGGALHESTRAWKDRWEFRTKWIPRATADTLEAALQAAPPLACSGDFFGGAVNVFVAEIRGITSSKKFAAGEHVIYEFSLEEA